MKEGDLVECESNEVRYPFTPSSVSTSYLSTPTVITRLLVQF